MTFKIPDNVVDVDLTHLLSDSLDEPKSPLDYKTLAYCLRKTVDELHSALLPNRGSKAKNLLSWMEEPRIGQLVVEISTTPGRDGKDINAVGVLEKVQTELVNPEETDPDNQVHVEFFYIRTIDGRLVKWENAKFITAPFPLKELFG